MVVTGGSIELSDSLVEAQPLSSVTPENQQELGKCPILHLKKNSLIRVETSDFIAVIKPGNSRNFAHHLET